MSEYVPTPSERWMIGCLQGTINQILAGGCEGAAICSVDPNGTPSFVFYQKPDDPVLRDSMSKLLGLYEMKQQPSWNLMNTPFENRSYREH